MCGQAAASGGAGQIRGADTSDARSESTRRRRMLNDRSCRTNETAYITNEDAVNKQATPLLQFIASPRSVRHFADRPVRPELVESIVDVARWTGSARNRQPWRFMAVTNSDTRARLSRLGSYAQHVATAPLVLVVLSEANGRADTEFDVGRVVQSACLAAHALGLGACLATFHPADNVAAASGLLGVTAPWRPHHAISIGWPAPARVGGRSAIPTGRLATADLLLTPPTAG